MWYSDFLGVKEKYTFVNFTPVSDGSQDPQRSTFLIISVQTNEAHHGVFLKSVLFLSKMIRKVHVIFDANHDIKLNFTQKRRTTLIFCSLRTQQ